MKNEKLFEIRYCCDELKDLVELEDVYFYSNGKKIVFHLSESDLEFYFCPFCGKQLSEDC